MYSSQTIERAERALRCCPFQLSLFSQMKINSIDLNEIIDQMGVQKGYTQAPLSLLTVENQLNWLIQVGLLRREVDGQGITDSFRLTPLGRQLITQWETSSLEGKTTPEQGGGPLKTHASLCDRVLNTVNRVFPFLF